MLGGGEGGDEKEVHMCWEEGREGMRRSTRAGGSEEVNTCWEEGREGMRRRSTRAYFLMRSRSGLDQLKVSFDWSTQGLR